MIDRNFDSSHPKDVAQRCSWEELGMHVGWWQVACDEASNLSGKVQRVMRSILVGGLVILGILFCGQAIGQETNQSASAEIEETQAVETPTSPIESFEPDFSDQDLFESRERAWEFRPYLVAVWFCLDGSPLLESNYHRFASDVTRRSELVDPSGWDITTGRAPAQWRVRFQNQIENPESIEGFKEIEELDRYDKLMIVCLNELNGSTQMRVREFDVQTQLWGPLLERDVQQIQQLGNHLMQAISVSFMPLAKIDRIQDVFETRDDGKKIKLPDEVIMRLRGVDACVAANSIVEQMATVNVNEEDELVLTKIEPVAIESSPVYIKKSDRFLPIIRQTDKNGDLVRLTPIDFTYLVVKEQSPGDSEIRCHIESNRGAPLSQRKSKKAQKLAVVIRPPSRPTKLCLVSSDRARTPMEGFDIYSRRPGQVGGKNEYLGKTDWQGSIQIPPSKDGLRIILVSRGSRRMRRLPIIPGLYDSVVSTLPNDETRLYAEGVIRGLQNDVLSLVIRRKVIEGEIATALENKELARAKDIFRKYEDLETAQDIKDRMSAEEVNLKTQTRDSGELDYINRMFDSLRGIVNKEQRNSKEMELTKQIQEMSAAQKP